MLSARKFVAHSLAVMIAVGGAFQTFAFESAYPGLIGLVEIPTLFDASVTGGSVSTPIALRERPSFEAPVIAWAGDANALEHYEWSYEAPAAAVYGYRHDGDIGWLRVNLVSGRTLAWLAAADVAAFHPLSEIMRDSLAYLTKAWDGRVHARAGDPKSASSLGVRGNEVPIAVAASARVRDEVWYLVTVLGESPCSSADAPSVVGAGWVPEHAASGDLNLWFFSRGC